MTNETTAPETTETAPAVVELTLKEKITGAALDAAEDHLFLALEEIKTIGSLLVEETANPFDNVAFNGILLFETQLRAVIDKVDGKVG